VCFPEFMSENSEDNSTRLSGHSTSSVEDEPKMTQLPSQIGHHELDDDMEFFLKEMQNELESIISESKSPSDSLSPPSAPKYISFLQSHNRSSTVEPKSYSVEGGWTLYTSEEGYPYYYNSITNESEWAPIDESKSSTQLLPLLQDLEGVAPSPSRQPISTITNVTPGSNSWMNEQHFLL
jgi:hypothetical protein